MGVMFIWCEIYLSSILIFRFLSIPSVQPTVDLPPSFLILIRFPSSPIFCPVHKKTQLSLSPSILLCFKSISSAIFSRCTQRQCFPYLFIFIIRIETLWVMADCCDPIHAHLWACIPFQTVRLGFPPQLLLAQWFPQTSDLIHGSHLYMRIVGRREFDE